MSMRVVIALWALYSAVWQVIRGGMSVTISTESLSRRVTCLRVTVSYKSKRSYKAILMSYESDCLERETLHIKESVAVAEWIEYRSF